MTASTTPRPWRGWRFAITMTEIKTETTAASPTRAIVPYVLPMFAFLLLSSLEGYLPNGPDGRPSPGWYPAAYTLKIAIVAGLMWACRSTWRDLSPRPSLGALALAVVLGVLIIVAWVGLDGHYPTFAFLGTRTAFDPNLLHPAGRHAFLAIRLLGLVVLVPLFEELFWRSFLIRWLVADDFTQVPIGRVTPLAAVVSSVIFGLVHPEWLPGVIAGFAWAWLVWHTKSLTACVVSHATANLALGLYVIATGDWKFW
jgi:CAAX prenyl protease-like protein